MSEARSIRSTSPRPGPRPPDTGPDGDTTRRARPGIARILVGIAIVAAAIAAGAAGYLATRPSPSALFEGAEADLQAERWDAARARMRRLAAIRPPTPLDRLLRARIEVGAGNDAGALEELQQIVDDPGLGPQALFMSGLIERRRNRLRYAEAAYRRAIAGDPRLLSARRELIYILGMQSRRRELDASFKAMAQIAPLSHYDLYIWCLTHFVNWGSDSADDLRPYVDADPDDRHSRLAMAALLIGQPGQEARVDDVLRPLPQDDPEVIALRAEQQLNRGQSDEAARIIAATQADDPRLDRLRGRLALRRGDRAVAVGFFRRALSDEPYDRVSNAELGKALVLQGDRAEARTFLDRAKQLDEVYNLVTRIGKPDKDGTPPDLNRLAQACESAGLIEEARGWYSLAIAHDPLDPDAQQGLHRLPRRG